MTGHPGRAKTLILVQRLFTWPSIKQLLNHYVTSKGHEQPFRILIWVSMAVQTPNGI
ncbi:uncharacterized protein VP01_3661g3 [Puccinia sorghi]|uniref:Integrase zinc-binding domain-containing protein n=1 Tax=Puccinia sorghi TaxID=27349 RepID=A0A0L6UUF4_9BASI|nr:uncharacterized protein VP01_3661g3 [Puccinia sorghi]